MAVTMSVNHTFSLLFGFGEERTVMASKCFLFWTTFAAFLHLFSAQQQSSAKWNPDLSSRRIVGGNEVQHGRFPYVVGMLRKADEAVVCGGVVYDTRHVLSAAHCFDKREPVTSIRVLGGVVNRLQLDDPKRIELDILEEYKHPLFDGSEKYDITVLRVNGKFSPYMLAPSESKKPVQPNEKCVLAGWGGTVPIPAYDDPMAMIRPEIFPDVMNFVTFPLIPERLCKTLYSHFNIGPQLFCAGDLQGGHDGCVGDSGSPLVCGDRLMGIMSAGAGCAEIMRPGIYINVTHFKAWIDSTINQSYIEEEIHQRSLALQWEKLQQARELGFTLWTDSNILNGIQQKNGQNLQYPYLRKNKRLDGSGSTPSQPVSERSSRIRASRSRRRGVSRYVRVGS